MTDTDSSNIYNTDNYKEKFKKFQYKQFTKLFIELINEFLVHLSDKILLQNQGKYFFVIQRGIETMTHIFENLLLYTKNIELTIFHCKRAYIYYVEFIGQIGDDKNSYLQLNSKDATLFVYKKTIFEINNEYRKSYTISQDDTKLLNTMRKLNNIYKKILLHIISIDHISINNKEMVIPFATKTSSKIVEKLLNFNTDLNNLLEKGDICYHFINILEHKDLDSIKYANIIECFVKKLKKTDITETQLNEKIYNSNFNNILNNFSPYKFIVWLYS